MNAQSGEDFLYRHYGFDEQDRDAREFVAVAGQRALVSSMGGDPDKEISLSPMLSPEARGLVENAYHTKIAQEVDFLLNDPDVIEAVELRKSLVEQSKAANKGFYDWANGEGAMASMEELTHKYYETFEPIQIPEELRSRYTQLAGSITQKLKSISPSLTAYSHPDLTGVFKTLLGVSGVQPDYYEQGVAGPLYKVPGGEEGALGIGSELAIAATLGGEAAFEGLANLPIKLAKGSWNAYAWMKGAVTNKWDDMEFPLDFLIPKDYVFDQENNRYEPIDAPITIPHLWHGVAAGLQMQEAQSALQSIEDKSATLSWMRNRDAPWALKMFDEAAMFTGSLYSFTKVAGGALGWGNKVGAKVGLGLAKVVSKTPETAKIAAIMSKAGAVAGSATAFGAFEALSSSARTPEEMWMHFGEGVRNGLVFHYLGELHGKASRALMKKRIPKDISERLGAAVAGLGFGVYELGTGGMEFQKTEIADKLHGFVAEPTQKSWDDYAKVIGKNVLGMMMHSSLFGRHAAHDNALRAAIEGVSEKRAGVAEQKQAQMTEYVAEAAAAKPEVAAFETGPMEERTPTRERPGATYGETAAFVEKARSKLGEQGKRFPRTAAEVAAKVEEIRAGRAGRKIKETPTEVSAKAEEILSNQAGKAPQEPVFSSGGVQKPGLIQRLANLTKRRLAQREKQGEGYLQREVGMFIARPVLGGKTFAALTHGNVDAKNGPSWDPAPAEARLHEILSKNIGEEAATSILTDLRAGGRLATIHTHETPVSFSNAYGDLHFYSRMFNKGGGEPQIMVNPERVEIVMPKPGKRPPPESEWNSIGAVFEERWHDIIDKELEGAFGPDRKAQEPGWEAIKSLSYGLKVEPKYRALAERVMEANRGLTKELIDAVGMDYFSYSHEEASRAFQAWSETGNLSAFRNPPPAPAEQAVLKENLKRDLGVEADAGIDPGAASYARLVLKDEGPAAAWAELEVLVGESVANIPHTAGNLESLLSSLEGRPVPRIPRWDTGRGAVNEQKAIDMRLPTEPSDVEGARQVEQNIREALGRPSDRRVQDRVSIKNRFRSLWKGLQDFDPAKVGFLKKFEGPDFSAMVSAHGRLGKLARQGRNQVQVDIAHALEPLIPSKESGLSRKERLSVANQNVKQLEIYGGLRDLTSNYMQKRLVQHEDGTISLDEIPSKLPGGYAIEDYRAALTKMEGELKPEVREAYKRTRDRLDAAWFEYATLKGLDPDSRQTDYWPREVKDFVDLEWLGRSPGKGPHGRPLDPFRSYSKTRTGTERATEFSIEGVEAYLTKMQYDNAVHRWTRLVGDSITWRAERETGKTIDDMLNMESADWFHFYDNELMPRGFRTVDLSTGERGKLQFERSLEALDAYAALQGSMPDMPIIGRSIRPNGKNRFLFTDQAIDLIMKEKQRSMFTHPLWQQVNRVIGKWFKVPALRGPLGVLTPARNIRNAISDVAKIFEQDSIAAATRTVRYLGESGRLLKKIRKSGVESLDPSEASLWSEFEYFGTGGKGEFTDIGGNRDLSLIERFDPSMRTIFGKIKDLVRGDVKWARDMDHFFENWTRFAYFLGERMQAIPRGEQLPTSALENIHIKSGEVLVNYDWLTPFEKTALNGVLVPFYTWARWNLAGTAAALKKDPLKAGAKMALPALAMHLFNLAVFGQDEQRLVDKWPGLAQRPHLILPFSDSLGNKAVIWFQTPSAEGLQMFGLDGIFGRTPSTVLAISQGEGGMAFQEAVRGTFQSATEAAQRMVNPLITAALGTQYKSKFVGVPQVGTATAEGLGSVFPPAGVALSAADILGEVFGSERVKPERTATQQVSRYVPFLSFMDVSAGLPWGSQVEEYRIGHAQSDEQRMAGRYRKYSKIFANAIESGDRDLARRTFATAWGEVEPTATRYGLTQENILARMVESAKRLRLKEKLIEAGRAPKLSTISKRQAAMLYGSLYR